MGNPESVRVVKTSQGFVSFIKIFSNLSKYSFAGSFEGWMKRIVVNTALDEIRRNSKHNQYVDAELVDYKLEQKTFISDNLTEEDLLKVINSLSEGYKLVFNLYAIEGFTHKEIGEKLGISVNTSKSQYSRARVLIMKKLEEVGFER